MGKQMLKAALAWRGKSKVWPPPLSCAYHQDSMFKPSGLRARGSPLLTHFCTATPSTCTHCVLPLPWELTSTKGIVGNDDEESLLARLQCKPFKRSSAPGFMQVSKDKTKP